MISKQKWKNKVWLEKQQFEKTNCLFSKYLEAALSKLLLKIGLVYHLPVYADLNKGVNSWELSMDFLWTIEGKNLTGDTVVPAIALQDWKLDARNFLSSGKYCILYIITIYEKNLKVF